MKEVKVRRNDLDPDYDAIHFIDRYLLKQSEADSIDVRFEDILDMEGLYARLLHSNYG